MILYHLIDKLKYYKMLCLTIYDLSLWNFQPGMADLKTKLHKYEKPNYHKFNEKKVKI